MHYSRMIATAFVFGVAVSAVSASEVNSPRNASDAIVLASYGEVPKRGVEIAAQNPSPSNSPAASKTQSDVRRYSSQDNGSAVGQRRECRDVKPGARGSWRQNDYD